MNGDDLVHLPAWLASDKIRQGELSIPEYVRTLLDRIEAIEPKVHAWVHLDPDAAMAQARSLQERLEAGDPIGSLPGIPVGVKDVFNTRDMPTQMGSPIWKDFTPGNDARTVHSLRMAGAVVPGKTVTAEFAVHTPGPTLNPHDPESMAGTSSTGSAVAVATGMVPIALGTQTGGSITRPASYCGVYGFKPSFGLVPRTGTLKTTDSLDTIGGFARCARDISLLFETLHVRGEDYPFSHARLSDQGWAKEPGKPWKVALVRGPKWNHAEDYARASLERFARDLSRVEGVEVEEAELPESLGEAHRVHATIYDRTLAYYFKEEFKRKSLVSGIMYEIIERGNAISLDEYKRALDHQRRIAADLDAFFGAGRHVALDLATGGEALKGVLSVDRPDNCLVWTLCGVPALALPLFRGPRGLPFGGQILARRYADPVLLEFAQLLEDAGLVPPIVDPFA